MNQSKISLPRQAEFSVLRDQWYPFNSDVEVIERDANAMALKKELDSQPFFVAPLIPPSSKNNDPRG